MIRITGFIARIVDAVSSIVRARVVIVIVAVATVSFSLFLMLLYFVTDSGEVVFDDRL